MFIGCFSICSNAEALYQAEPVVQEKENQMRLQADTSSSTVSSAPSSKAWKDLLMVAPSQHSQSGMVHIQSNQAFEKDIALVDDLNDLSFQQSQSIGTMKSIGLLNLPPLPGFPPVTPPGGGPSLPLLPPIPSTPPVMDPPPEEARFMWLQSPSFRHVRKRKSR